ncbi:restriction endonuclease [Pseudoxanthomonas sp. SL93]|uniref:restriction endonuclease n=1 Tax=Pseudoxanthomonas sp. SL93 TaxID=2995142 RepID=UPI00227159F0|nr:restriction endonuclease [Pseudoxanthomonas sp. SL93]WAC62074.1 restriction endonuclease [Pseudoxanthomonas sp. SL93]
MSIIKASEMRVIDRVLGMESGYVLNFSDRTIAEFFLDELNIDFNDERFATNGTSKAKRLRTFLQTVDKGTAARTLRQLLKYRVSMYQLSGQADDLPNADGMLLEVVARLEGKMAGDDGGRVPSPASVPVPIEALKSALIALHDLAPQPRGYAFEKFTTDFFQAYGLQPNSPFRLVGEQIDGSFKFDGEFYLLEAKWQGPRTPAADLRNFHGKVQEKASWARGLFISNSGFSDEGLHAFGRAKSIICMDGYDVWTMLNNRLPLPEVLDRKVRHAAERGEVFCSVADLFGIKS